MSRIAKSPQRHTFQLECAKERAAENGNEVPEFYENFWKSAKQQDEENLVDPKWQRDNLEYDLRSTEWICNKAKASDAYAQNLYAAMCNQDWQRLEVMPILRDQRWSCSWRYAGGVVADFRDCGEDYMNWYCSGIGPKEDTEFVGEGNVTDEIRADLALLGWRVIEEPDSK